MRVAFAGTPEFALPALEALIAQHEVVGVLTQPDRPSGRGRHLSSSPVKRLAAAHALPLLQPTTLKSEEAHAQLAAWKAEVLIVMAYGLLLPPEVLRVPRYGCINIHASLLPRWRGAAPVQRAILAGDSRTGVTIMQMDAGLDTGPILLSRELVIGEHDTAGSLLEALSTLGATTLLAALESLAAGTLSPRPQPQSGVTHAAKIAKSEARIDWSQDAASIERRVRAFNPWPIAETELGGERFRIHSAVNVSSKVEKVVASGSIIALNDGNLLVQCGQQTVLGLREVQKPGRRVLQVSELAHNLSLVGQRFG